MVPLQMLSGESSDDTIFDNPSDILTAGGVYESNSVALIGPSAPVVHELATHFLPHTPDLDASTCRILADKAVLDTVTDDALTEFALAAGIKQGAAAVRVRDTDEDPPRQAALPRVILTDDTVSAVVDPGVVSESDPDYIQEVKSTYDTVWEASSEYRPLSRMTSKNSVQEAAQNHLSEPYLKDFEAIIEAVESLGTSDDPIGMEDVVFALGARHEATQYDIGSFAEDAGLVSKATISRVKLNYEDLGVIETTQVPQDVGRPRDRVKFADEEFAEASLPSLIEKLRELRASRSA